jgi:hypothetical protein
VVDALGWAGDPAVLPLLLNLLANDDRDVVFSAAGALERITGAGLTEEIEIPAEEVMGGATSSSSPAAPNAQDANDPGETPSPDLIELPSTNQEQWRSFLEENQGRFLPGVRMRAGRQYTPLVSLDLLEFSPASPADRRALHWEIVTRTGYLVPFDVTAFVPVQDERLRQIRSLIQARSWNEGVWELPMTRQTFSPPSALSS